MQILSIYKMWNQYLLIILFSVCGILSQVTNVSDATDCTCVIYYLCNMENMTIITNGEGIIDIRAGFPTCERQEEICCRIEDKVITAKTVETSSCGIRHPRGVGTKIFNEKTNFNLAEFGEFPWMVGIISSNGGYRCGGSLIHPSVVLTAAHCVLEQDTYVVRAGEWDSANTKEIRGHQDNKVSSIKIHKNYTPGIYHNDIALLFLESPFTLDVHINTICLPPANITVTGRCYTHGWGRDRFTKGRYPSILKKIEVPIVSYELCQKNLRKTMLGPQFKLHRSFVCAGGEEGKDACIGDGGGPLVCRIREEEEQYQQIGIVSWGIGCGSRDMPGVYANVAFLRDWIDEQMKENNIH